jgi:hypothetical protein
MDIFVVSSENWMFKWDQRGTLSYSSPSSFFEILRSIPLYPNDVKYNYYSIQSARKYCAAPSYLIKLQTKFHRKIWNCLLLRMLPEWKAVIGKQADNYGSHESCNSFYIERITKRNKNGKLRKRKKYKLSSYFCRNWKVK